jgi:hypothetical protein
MFNPVDPKVFGDGFNTESKECYRYKDSHVFFLLSRRGMALEIHVAAIGRRGKKRLREACKAIIEQVPNMFPWCKMLIAPVKLASVYNLCIKLGFEDGGLIDYPPDKARMMVVNYG